MTIDSKLSIDQKKGIISKLLFKLNTDHNNSQDTLYSFRYQRKWWAKDYDVFINIDQERFYLTVLLRTSYFRGGFIDFGGSEKLRNNIISIIKSFIDHE